MNVESASQDDKRCACVSDDPGLCYDLRYRREYDDCRMPGETCECPCHEECPDCGQIDCACMDLPEEY